MIKCKNVFDSYKSEIIFDQEDLNIFCKIMHLEQTAHDDVEQAKLLGYQRTLVPVIFAMSTSLSILNNYIFPDYEPLELYREYTCIRPIFVDDIYYIDYLLNHIDYEEQIGTVIIRIKNKKGQICVNGLVKLKLIDVYINNI